MRKKNTGGGDLKILSVEWDMDILIEQAPQIPIVLSSRRASCPVHLISCRVHTLDKLSNEWDRPHRVNGFGIFMYRYTCMCVCVCVCVCKCQSVRVAKKKKEI